MRKSNFKKMSIEVFIATIQGVIISTLTILSLEQFKKITFFAFLIYQKDALEARLQVIF